jgi:hypothetical protein
MSVVPTMAADMLAACFMCPKGQMGVVFLWSFTDAVGKTCPKFSWEDYGVPFDTS